MATVIIDGEAFVLGQDAKTLGDLVAEADDRFGRQGRIVTAVRLEGVEEPAFREPRVTMQAATDFDRIEIESGTEAELVASCLFEAGTALHSLANDAAEVAALYRFEQIEDANGDLATITQGIATALAITSAASLGLGVDLGQVATPEGTITELTTETARALDALIAAQLHSDWLATADLLENNLAPVLRRWSAVCGVLQPNLVC
jgi:hypothetical protein